LEAKLQSRITEAKVKGEDVSSLETILTDMQSKIADAKTQANAAIDAASALQPTDYPENKPSLQNARALLQTAHKDLITARQDAQKIVVALRKSDKNIILTPEASEPHESTRSAE
jgi:F0F1-type ATP synthase membrane subunit b/b'